MQESDLNRSVRFVRGVGEKLHSLLHKKGIDTVEDALYFFPRRYEDRRQVFSVKEAIVSDQAVVIGRILRAYPVNFSRSRRRSYEVLLEDLDDGFHRMVLKWFHKPYVFQKLNPGTVVMVTGSIKAYRSQLQMPHPEIEVLGKEYQSETKSPGIIPIYSQTEGLYQKTLRKIQNSIAKAYSSELIDPLPATIVKDRALLAKREAVYQLHCPSNEVDFHQLNEGHSEAHRRLIYEEFFYFSLILALNRKGYVDRTGISFKRPEKLWDLLRENVGFKFTEAQRRVLKEILDDMSSSRVMYRMVQGDVGSGKTVVAAASAMVALESGFQVAVMAPTEVLANQHFQKFKSWFEGSGISVLKLTGSMAAADRKPVLESLKADHPSVVCGTHALFEKGVEFSKLGLVIVDEQHRFGVRQRARLVEKGDSPDVLVMTATPIPRTLALTIYGDLDISVIDELPPGRKPIETKVFTDKQRPQLNSRLQEELKNGRQVYIVFPLIEESEALTLKSIQVMLPELEMEFPEAVVSCLHGKMKPDEKSAVLEEFRQNKIQVLVSTTVIEVGVDVPNATVMVIENAERFGLSQLHQLRGRVGRGGHQSYCFLVASHLGGEEIRKRLKAMELTQDGFKLSEVDLEMRGPGEFIGTKQSGLPAFRLAQLPRDLKALQEARRDAFDLVEKSPELTDYPILKESLRRQFRDFHLA